MIPKISVQELKHHMEALPEQRFCFLVGHVLRLEGGMDCEVLSMADMLKLALCDWMTRISVVDADDQQKIVNAFDGAIRKFTAKATDNERWPIAQMGFLDFQFVALNPQYTENKGFYSLKKDRWVKNLPHHPLTLLYCDLSSLMARLVKRIEKTRELQDVTDKKPAD
jgi:hypothetical protein